MAYANTYSIFFCYLVLCMFSGSHIHMEYRSAWVSTSVRTCCLHAAHTCIKSFEWNKNNFRKFILCTISGMRTTRFFSSMSLFCTGVVRTQPSSLYLSLHFHSVSVYLAFIMFYFFFYVFYTKPNRRWRRCCCCGCCWCCFGLLSYFNFITQ